MQTKANEPNNDYCILELVGEGSFGKVYKGRRKFTGQIVALKFIRKGGKPDKDIRRLRGEIEILKTLRHENIILMLDCYETPSDFVVVTEYAQGELFQILEADHTLPEGEIQKIAKQLVRALQYLHSNRIIHRDMKPQVSHRSIGIWSIDRTFSLELIPRSSFVISALQEQCRAIPLF